MAVDLGSAFGRILLDVTELEAAAKSVEGFKRVSVIAFSAVATAAKDITEALFGIAEQSLEVASEFEDQMAILSTAASGAGVGLETLSDAALAVGADTALVGVSASGAADAMTGLYKSGLTTTEIFGDLNGYLAGTAELGGALRAAIDLAAASELDMVQASKLAATVLNTFGGELKTEEERANFINEALNNMVQTAGASSVSVSELADALVNIGPSAAAMGFSITDTNKALGILADRGIKGSEAGTALRSLFTQLTSTTGDVKDTLAELNVQLYDADGQMRSLPDILTQLQGALFGVSETTVVTGGRTAEQNHQLELARRAYTQATDAIYKHNSGLKTLTDAQLQKYVEQQAAANAEIQNLESISGEATTALSQLTEQERLEAIQTLAGTYGKNALNSLLAAGTEGWNALGAATSDAATIQEVAAARTETLTGKWEALQGVWETIQINIGNELIPTLQGVLEWAAVFAEQYGPQLVDVFHTIGALPGQIRTLWETDLLGLRELFAGLWEAAQQAFETFKLVFTGDFQGWPEGLQAAWETLWTAITDFMGNLWTLIQPYLQAFWESLTTWFYSVDWIGIGQNVAQFLADGVAALWSYVEPQLTAFIEQMRAAIDARFPGLVDTIIEVWNQIRDNIQIAIDYLVPLITDFVTNVVTWFQDNWTTIQAVVLTAWTVIQDVIKAAISVIWPAIVDFVQNVIASLSEFKPVLDQLAILWQNLKPVIAVVAAAIGAIIVALVGVISGAMRGIALAVGPLIKTFADVAAGVLRSVNGIISYVRALWDAIVALFHGNTDEVIKATDRMRAAALEIFEGLVDAATGLVKGLWDTLISFIGGMVSGITDYFQTLYDNLVGHSLIPDLINDIVAWFTDTDWLQLGLDVVQGIADGISNSVSVVAEAARGAAQSAFDAAKRFLGIGSPSRLMADEIGAPMTEGIASGLTRNIGVVLDAFEQLAKTVEIEGVKKFAKVIDKVVSVIEPAIEAVQSLSEFEGVGSLVRPISDLAANLRQVLSYFHILAGEFWDALAPIKTFASTAKAAVDIIKPAIDGLSALAEYKPLSNTAAYVGALVSDIRLVIAHMANAAQGLLDVLGPVAQFAATAGEVVKIIKPAIDALVALGDFVAAEGLEGKTAEFTVKLSNVIKALGAAFQWMAGLSAETLEQAQAIFDTINDVVKVVKPSVEALGLLSAFTASADLERRTALFTQLLSQTIQKLGQGFAWMANLSAETLAQAVQVFSTIESVISVVKPGIEALAALVSFDVDIKQLAVATYRFMTAFSQTVRVLVNGLTAVAQIVTLDALDAAVELANSVDDLASKIKSIVDRFTDLGQLEMPSISKAMGNLTAQANTLRDTILALAADLATIAHTKLPDGINLLVSVAISSLSPLPAAFNNVGVQSVNALVNAFFSGIPAIQAAAYQAARAAYDTAMQALQIGSPSKLFENIGTDTMAGLVNGIIAGIPAVQQATQMAAAATVPVNISPTPVSVSSPVTLYGGQTFQSDQGGFDIMRALEALQ